MLFIHVLITNLYLANALHSDTSVSPLADAYYPPCLSEIQQYVHTITGPLIRHAASLIFRGALILRVIDSSRWCKLLIHSRNRLASLPRISSPHHYTNTSTVNTMHDGSMLSCCFCQIVILPFENWDSDHATFFQSSILPVVASVSCS